MTWRAPCALLRDASGVAGWKRSLVISLVLAPLCMGVAAYAMVLVDVAQLDRALQGALFYIWSNPTGFSSPGGVRTAAAAGYRQHVLRQHVADADSDRHVGLLLRQHQRRQGRVGILRRHLRVRDGPGPM